MCIGSKQALSNFQFLSFGKFMNLDFFEKNNFDENLFLKKG